MFQETQKRDSTCLKLPKGNVPTDQEIRTQIGLLNEDAQANAHRAWSKYNAQLKTDPQQAANTLVSYIEKHGSRQLCDSSLSPENASKLFLRTLQTQVKGEVRESFGRLIETFRGFKKPKD